MGLDHQVAIVTGATSETGRAYVKHLLLNRVKVKKKKKNEIFFFEIYF